MVKIRPSIHSHERAAISHEVAIIAEFSEVTRFLINHLGLAVSPWAI